MMMSREW